MLFFLLPSADLGLYSYLCSSYCDSGEMLLEIFCVVLGITLVLWAADRFTDGASALAYRLNVAPIVIGVTVVGFATSLPEFCISVMANVQGSPGIALGNVMGSNIFNVFAVVGCAAMLIPIAVTNKVVGHDIPWVIGSSLLVIFLSLWNDDVSRLDSLILLVTLVVFMTLTLRGAKKRNNEEKQAANPQIHRLSWCLVWITVGLAVLVMGSRVFIYGATGLATRLGMSDAVVGITIVACGTSLPEFAATMAATVKKQPGIALGNVIGSNVLNNLMIVGVAGAVCPMRTVVEGGFSWIDMAVFALSGILLWLFARTHYKIVRWEGIVLFLFFALYMIWLVWSTLYPDCAAGIVDFVPIS